MGLLLLALVVTGVTVWLGLFLRDARALSPVNLENRIPVAVLGDSDSHSFADRFDNVRGGEFGEVSYNWTQLWNLLYPEEVEQGTMGVWGTHYAIARVMYRLGLRAKAPRKFDFQHNYAYSGQGCDSLLHNWPYQARWLQQTLRRDQDYWHNGLVIIRIGINDFAQYRHYGQWRETGLDNDSRSIVKACIDAIIETTEILLGSHEGVTVAISGVVRNYNAHPPTGNEFSQPDLDDYRLVEEVLNYFDSELQQYSHSRPRVAFFDDKYWLASLFGDKAAGQHREFAMIDDRFRVNYGSGDHPENIVLADLHGGTIYNGLWLRNMLQQINSNTDYNFSLPTESQLVEIVCRHEQVSC